jgi:hypothetical protein
MTTGERKTKKRALLIGLGLLVFAFVGFAVGFNSGRKRQMKGDAAVDLAISLNHLSSLERNDLEKLNRDLRFLIYANVDIQNRLGGIVTNGMSSNELARASAIHNQMSTQVVSSTPEQLVTNVSGK